MKEIFKRIITEFIEREIPDYTERDLVIPHDAKKIITLIGARRTGKTTIILNTVKKLRRTVNPERVVYINFEDDRVFPLELRNLDDILEAYFELYPNPSGDLIYLFFDEVQNVKNWEKYVRRIYDSGRYCITVTGSSSKLLSGDLATSLRGRSLSYEVFPFSFREYLKHYDIKPSFYSQAGRGRIKNLFNRYMVSGGFPEFIDLDEIQQPKAVKEYNDLVIYKDILERYGAGNVYLMKYLIKYLFVNNSTLVSFNKIYNDFKSMGLTLGRNTIYEYASYLEDAYALFFVQNFSENIRVQNRNPKKVYLIDNSLKNLYTLKMDLGRNMENVVFLDLRRRSQLIYYLRDTKEIDFYLPMEKDFQLINVCYSVEDSLTKKREVDSLLVYMEKLRLNKGLILTNDSEGVVESGRRMVYLKPVWKWMLEGQDRQG